MAASTILDCKQVKKLDHDDELGKLWAFAKLGKAEDFFESCTVQRQEGVQRVSDFVKVPDAYLVLKEAHSLLKTFDISQAFIRQEYHEVLEDIIGFATGKQTDFPVDKKYHQGGEDAEEEITYPTQIKNPFVNQSAHQGDATKYGVIITGHSGIGKSVWLVYVLILRLLAGQPTIYQTKGGRLDLFTTDGVFRIDVESINAADIASFIPPETWVLVDSGKNLVGVPTIVKNLGRFIVQAAPPKPSQMQWKDKIEAQVLIYFMRPWTLPELILGRTLQLSQSSEAQLEIFYNIFVPSPREAYTHATNVTVHERNVRAMLPEVAKARPEDLVHTIEKLDWSGALQHVFTLIPSPRKSDAANGTRGGSRTKYEAKLPTPRMARMYMDSTSSVSVGLQNSLLHRS